MEETISVRQGEELDKEALHCFLMKAITNYPVKGKLEISQFPAGASNLTYLLCKNDWQAVLRRPPLGPLPPKAHDMKREYDFLSALAPSFSYAPKPLALGVNTEVMDVVFYVMERREGIVLDTAFPAHIKGTMLEGQQVSELLIDTLVNLHQIEPNQTGIGHFGKPEGFMERQVVGWIGRYERAQTEEIAEYLELARWLKEKIPSTSEARIIHNDFKFNNMLFSRDLSEVRAVVDWEMATVGDPLFDLGVVLSYWTEPSDPIELRKCSLR
ncbi:phosphotransferase family protein [Bacillus sp. JCM 19041]|uniref:phosphotransferase family protein n=1 Tax=Bacillus sp. JCM 19041 TaxID=1460637 RepID=UPI00336AB18A